MDEKELEEFLNLLPEEQLSLEELEEIIGAEGLDVFFDQVPEGAFASVDEMKSFFPSLKKKDSSESPVISPEENTESPVTPVQEDPTSPVSTSTQEPEITGVTPQESTQENQQDQIDEVIIEQQEQEINAEDIVELNPSKYGQPTEEERDFWFEEMTGNIPIVGGVTDFFGDMIRAAQQGTAQGATVDDAMGLLLSGGTMTDEDLQEYIKAVKEMNQMPMSDEMRAFNKTYKANGGGILGFVLGLGQNLSVAPALLVSSIAASFNPTVAAGAGTGAALGAGTGAALTSAGGPLAIFGAGAGGIGGAIAGASATLETGLAFTEFLQEAITEKGLNFDKAGIRQVLEDPESIQKIRNRAAARGISIGLIDGLTFGVATKVGGKTIRLAKEAGKTVTKPMKARAALKTTGIEAVGGSAGEMGGRIAAGQEMDVAEIGFEGIAGTSTAIFSVPAALKGVNIFKPPRYILNKTKMSKQDLEIFLDTATLEEIRTMNIDVVNDPATAKRVTDLFSKAQYDKQLPDYVKGEDRSKLIDLEIEKQSIANTELESSKIRLQEIKNEIKTILEKSKEQPTEVSEPDAKTKELAKEELISEGIVEPTVEQIKLRQQQLTEKGKNIIDNKNIEEGGLKPNGDLPNNKNRYETYTSDTMEVNMFVEDDQGNSSTRSENDYRYGIRVNKRRSDTGNMQRVESLTKFFKTPEEAKAYGEKIILRDKPKTKQDAIQKSSTESVDVQEQSTDGQTVGERDTEGAVTQESQEAKDVPIETQTQEEISVNIAPFYETSIESTTEASGLRKSPQYEQYKQGIQDTANELGIEIQIDEGVGGYVNDAGTKIREISNVVRLKKATLQQAAEFASMLAALSPEVQESSIAAEYVADDSPGVSGQEYTLEVSDAEGTFQALKEVGIDEYTLNESNNLLTLFKFNDATEVDVLNKLKQLKENLDGRNIQYTAKARESIKSEYITVEERKSFLTALRRNLIDQGKEGTNLYKKVISAINRDAENQGISPNEYISPPSKPKVTADPTRVQSIIDEIVQKTKGRKAGESTSPEVLLKNTLQYLQESKLYQQLDDVARDNLVRQLNEQLGIKIPKAPNVKKVVGDSFGGPRPAEKKVLVNERVALKDQIKLEAKAVRVSLAAQKQGLKSLIGNIKNLGQRSTKIKSSQLTAIINKIRAARDLSNPAIEKNVLDFVETILSKAKLAEKYNSVSAKVRRAAKKNSQTKLGAVDPDLNIALQDVFSFSQYAVPESVLDNYLSLVQDFSRGKELKLTKDVSTYMEEANKIINAVNENANNIGKRASTSTSVTQKDVNEIVNKIQNNKIDSEKINNITNEDSKKIARFLNDLTKAEVEGLVKEKSDGNFEISKLKLLDTVLNNISLGVVSNNAFNLKSEVESNNATDKLTKTIDKIKERPWLLRQRDIARKIKLAITSSPSGKNTKAGVVIDRIRSNPKAFIDEVVGNYNNKEVYDLIIRPKSVAEAAARTELLNVKSDVDAAMKKISGGLTDKNTIAYRGMQLRLAQLYEIAEANKLEDGSFNKVAPPAEQFLDDTIKQDADYVNDPTRKMLIKLRETYVTKDGVNYKKLIDDFTPGMKEAKKILDKVNGSFADKALYISSVIHGNKVDLLNSYSHNEVVSNNERIQEIDMDRMNKFVNPESKTKAGNLINRTAGSKAISFNPFSSALRGAQMTLMDYYMSPVNKQVAKTINKLLVAYEDKGSTFQKSVVKALAKTTKIADQVIYINSLGSLSEQGVASKIAQYGYQATLASAPRAAAELAGNMTMAIAAPDVAIKGIKDFGKLSYMDAHLGQEILKNLGSSQGPKLFDESTIKSKHDNYGDFLKTKKGQGDATNSILNKIGVLDNMGPKQLRQVFNYVSQKLMVSGDQIFARPLYYGAFAKSFAAATKDINGKEINITAKDFKDFAEGKGILADPQYKEARDLATKKADDLSIIATTSTSPYEGIEKNIKRGEMKDFYRVANGFMARFSIFEFNTARRAVNALYMNGKGQISKTQAIGLLTGVTMRMSMYMVLYTALTQLLDTELLGIEDKDKEEEYEDLLYRQLIGAITQLFTRGSLGNIPNSLITFGLEYGVNEPLLGDLRSNEEYDPYKHAITFNQFQLEDFDDPIKKLFYMFAGPYNPLARTIVRTAQLGSRAVTRKTPEARQRAIDELTTRMVVEALGNFGLIPFYKDIRRQIIKERFGKKDPLSQKEINELRKKYPEYFSDVESSTSRTQRPTRKQSKKRQSRPTRR